MNALILAAGLGTRLGQFTEDRPKALVEVAGKTMLEHQLMHLHRAGVEHFVVNVHHFADKVIEFLDEKGNFGLDIRISDERDMLLDTGGGIRRAMHLFGNDRPVLVHNVDIFSGADLAGLYSRHLESGAAITLLTASRQTSRYLWFDSSSRLRGWNNTKTGQVRSPFADFDMQKCSPMAFQGIHVLSSEALAELDKVEKTAFSITDFYVDNAARLDIRTEKMPATVQWIDAGKPDALLSAAGIVSACYQ